MLLPPRSALRVLRCPPGGLIHLGAARRWIALPPARPAVFTLDKLGRPGWWGVWRSGIKEEAAGRGTAAAPNATPAWSATRPRCTTQLHRVPNKLARPGRWGVWRSGIKEEAAGRGTAAAPNATPAWSATRPRCTTQLHRVPNKLGRPGWWGVWRSGIKEEAAGRGTAAAPNATPAWSATPPRYTTQQIASKLGTLRGGLIWPGRVGRV